MEFNIDALVAQVTRDAHELSVALSEAKRLGIDHKELWVVKRNKKTFVARATLKTGETVDFKCNY